MNRQDVTVVGASAAGLFLAESLATSGLSVTVLERASEIDPAPRTLIVTRRVRDFLDGSLTSATVNTVRRYELVVDDRKLTVDLDEPDLVIERSTLIKALADRSRAAGAHIMLGSRFTGLRSGGDALTVTTGHNGRTREFATSAIVGADSANSSVARSAGWPRLPMVSVLQAIVRMPDDLSPDTTRVWFRPGDTPYFYWLISEGEDTGVLGIICDDPATARVMLDHFIEEQGMVRLAYQAARIPAYARWVRPHRRFGSGDVFLVGDAAGHVKVSTVGGIYTGFRGAKAIADIIIGGDRTELRGLRGELGRHLVVRNLLSRFAQEDYRRLFRLLESRSTDTLGSHSRDDSRALLLRLVLREPRLLLVGLRAIGIGKLGSRSLPPDRSDTRAPALGYAASRSAVR